MRKNNIIMIALFCVFLLAVGGIGAASVRTASERGYSGQISGFSFGGRVKLRNTIELPLKDTDSLSLIYGSKNIKVYPAEGDNITIKEYLCSGSPKALADVSYEDEKKATVTGGRGRTFVLFGFFMGEGERIEVYIPEKELKELQVETGSGNITLQAECIEENGSLWAEAGSGNIKADNIGTGALSLQAGSGNIRAEGLSGRITLQTGSGNIDGKALKGEAAINAGSGNITLKELSGQGSIEARSGNVSVEAMMVTGDMALRTGSGNIRLALPEGLSFSFMAETGSGNIHTDFEEKLAFGKDGKNAWGDIGETPNFQIHAKTGSGNLKIERK